MAKSKKQQKANKIRDIVFKRNTEMMSSLSNYASENINRKIKQDKLDARLRKIFVDINSKDGHIFIKSSAYFQIEDNRYFYISPKYSFFEEYDIQEIDVSYKKVLNCFKILVDTAITNLIDDCIAIKSDKKTKYSQELFPSANIYSIWDGFVTLENCISYIKSSGAYKELHKFANKLIGNPGYVCEFIEFMRTDYTLGIKFFIKANSPYIDTQVKYFTVECAPTFEMMKKKSIKECSEYCINNLRTLIENKIKNNVFYERYDYKICCKLKKTDLIAKHVCVQLENLTKILRNIEKNRNNNVKFSNFNIFLSRNDFYIYKHQDKYMASAYGVNVEMLSDGEDILDHYIKHQYFIATTDISILDYLNLPKDYVECMDFMALLNAQYQKKIMLNSKENRPILSIPFSNQFMINFLDINMCYNIEKQKMKIKTINGDIDYEKKIYSAEELLNIIIDTALNRQQEINKILSDKFKDLKINPVQFEMLKIIKSNHKISKDFILKNITSKDISIKGKKEYLKRLLKNNSDIFKKHIIKKNDNKTYLYTIDERWKSVDFKKYVSDYSIEDFYFLTTEGKKNLIYSFAKNVDNPESCWNIFCFLQKMPKKYVIDFCKSEIAVLFFKYLTGQEANYAQLYISELPGCKKISEKLFSRAILENLSNLTKETEDKYEILDELRTVSKYCVLIWLDTENGIRFQNSLNVEQKEELFDILSNIPGSKKYIKKLSSNNLLSKQSS